MPGRRILCVPALAVLALAVQGCGGASSGSASCAPPQVEASPASVSPGSTVLVTGRYFVDGCDDQGRGEVTPALRDQPVVWSQGDTSVPVDRVDADARGELSVQIRVPATATAGPASLTVGTAVPIPLVVTP